MKNFLYSVAGKTILIIFCTLLLVASLLSLVGGLACVSADIYTKDEEDVEEQFQQDWVKGIAHIYLQDVKLRAARKAPEIMEANEDAIIAVFAWNEETNDYSDLCAMTADYRENSESKNANSVWLDGYLSKGTRFQVEAYDKTGTLETSLKYQGLAFKYRYALWWLFGISTLLTIAAFVTLMTVSGRKTCGGELVCGLSGKIPVDGLVAIGIWMLFLLGEITNHSGPFITLGPDSSGEVLFPVVVVGLVGCGMIAFSILTCMNIAIHLKLRNLIKTTIIYQVLHLCVVILKKMGHALGTFFLAMPLVPKTVGVFAGISLLEIIGLNMFFYQMEQVMVLWFLEKCLLLPLVVYVAVMLKRLHTTANAMAEGELMERTDTTHMKGAFKEHAEYLGSIAQGMNIAVQEQVKSERMKTELITNVSHDLKTPLTSIVNYADLIGKEKSENKKIEEYSEILLKQAKKLKRLIEDLVEVSKATTGNLEVNLAPCNAAVFLEQAGGEYQEKLSKANLELIVNKPEMEVPVMADGRRMWRIFDNLMNNICKYAKEGTRVYLSLEKVGDQAVICFKNTSRAQLNISAQELMERFVRGEQSRTTEGNGLGLSIAKNLAELQNGKLDIEIDGDLFKVKLLIPCR